MSLFDYAPPPSGSNPIWWPVNGNQQAGLHSKAEMLLYGGASGGGKTDFLIADGAQERDNPNFRGLLLRKSFSEMQQIMDRMEAVYRPMGARWKGEEHTWIFPAGSRMRLGYMAADSDVGKYTGNPFSWLGVDESGFQTEARVRKIMPWLASTDPSLFPRVRLATNPGNVGMAWHLSVFLRGRCPIHYPAGPEDNDKSNTSVVFNRVYGGARWQTDGELTNKTVSFIPAYVTDNPLYGKEKVQSLESQTAEIRAQLLDGCWCDAEGMFFPFLRKSHVIPLAMIDEKWWWTHWFGLDYGYGNSSAAAGFYCAAEPTERFPGGQIYKIGETVQKKMGSHDFANHVCENFVLPTIEGSRRNISVCFIDSANDSHSGTGQSNFEIMAEVFAKFDIPCVKSAKDRIGNAQKLYKMLKSGEFTLCDTAPKAYTSLSTRIHDEKLGDVKKIHGDPLDDVYDETSYGINMWMQRTVKPKDEAIREKVEAMRKAGLDETSLWRHRWTLEQAAAKQEAPTRYARTKGMPVINR